MQIIPALLNKSTDELCEQLEKLSPYFSYFHLDIADGIFVPNKTIQIEDLIGFFSNYPLPATTYNLSFDFHLMVKDYEKEIKKLLVLSKVEGINIKNIFIHYSLRPDYQLLTTNYSLPIGLVLDPSDQVSDLAKQYDLNKIPFIQIMSVVPGFQGQPFIEETLNKIEQLRNLGYRSNIFIDGAINAKTIPIVLSKKYKPDFICPGSYLVKAENIKKRVDELNYLLRQK